MSKRQLDEGWSLHQGAGSHHKPWAGLRKESVTALMDQQFAVDTLVALTPKAPYPVTAVATVGFLGTHRGHTKVTHCEWKDLAVEIQQSQ